MRATAKTAKRVPARYVMGNFQKKIKIINSLIKEKLQQFYLGENCQSFHNFLKPPCRGGKEWWKK
ncbi:hypothetical protein [[Clostridium] aminophilum]|uniref:hypothetical protein n=1 Tax=[Clostridium] aminophilum TaxID=1526 RepID=UPI0026EB0EF6|nr:hypothetical protein [[Clostridium] aminophilum]